MQNKATFPIARLIAATALAACGGGGGSNDAGAEAGPPVSFQNDLLPTFENSCGLSTSCHQQMVTDPKVQRVFLGCKSTVCTFSPADVYAALMGPSQEDPSLPYVKGGDPAHSYLVNKLEGNLSSPPLQCLPLDMDPILQNAPGEVPSASQPCGAQMPLGSTSPLFATQVRAWIEQGAPDN